MALGLPVIILVGLRMGVFTPTEAAVVAAVYALFVAMVVYRELSFRQLADIFQAAARTSAVVMFLVAAAMVSAWLITVADLPSKIIGMLEPFAGQPDAAAGRHHAAGDDCGHGHGHDPHHPHPDARAHARGEGRWHRPRLLWRAVHHQQRHRPHHPPVGTGAQRGGRVGRISMSDVTRGVMPFMLAQFIVMFLLVAFPSIVMVPLRWLGG